MDESPSVSVVIPMYNEEGHIVRCLDSILANDYPKDKLEVLVVDGMSQDRSRELVQVYARRSPLVRLLDNPKRNQAPALNIGIGEAKGEIIVRMDAHTLYAPDYIRQCVHLLQTTGADNVGGVQRSVGVGYVSSAIAVAITSPFGVGDALFRFTDKPAWTDTVYLGAWTKSTLEDLGGFAEMGGVNEDYELNYRLRKRGGRILVSPKIRCRYFVRSSLPKLTRQYFRYGYWRVRTLVAHPDSLRWRQLAAPGLCACLLLSMLMLPFNIIVGMMCPGLYFFASVLASVVVASKRGWKYLPMLPALFACMHLSWGTGFWAGVAKWGVPRVTLAGVGRSLQKPRAQ